MCLAGHERAILHAHLRFHADSEIRGPRKGFLTASAALNNKSLPDAATGILREKTEAMQERDGIPNRIQRQGDEKTRKSHGAQYDPQRAWRIRRVTLDETQSGGGAAGKKRFFGG